MGEIIQRTAQTPDGRTLAIEEAGDLRGRPVLVHNGTPNSRHLYAKNAADAASRGLRLIGYDRPGYGGSTPHPGRTVADCSADVRGTRDRPLGHVGLLGWRAARPGLRGPAARSRHGRRVARVAGPGRCRGLDWFAGMGQLNVDDFKLFERDKVASRAKLEADREEMLAASPAEEAKMLESLLTPTDAAVSTGELAEYLSYCGHEGLAPSGEGWWEDGVADSGPWGFELSAISVPVLLLHGQQDQFVPFGHGVWLAVHVPGVEARLTDNDGHLTLLENRIPEVHAWLAERL